MHDRDIEGAASKFIDAGGLRTHYYEAGSGSPMLLIHGGGAGADGFGNWRGVIGAFAERYRVFAVDMVGFGRSEKPDPAVFEYSQSARVAHLIAFIDALELPRAHLVGNSMGGITGIGVAVERPDLVDRLVLMGSAGIRAPFSEELKSIMNYDYSIEGMRRIVRGLTNPDFEVDEDVVAYRHALSVEPATRAAYGATMGWLQAQGGLFYQEDYIRKVACRTLVVNGKLDLVVPIASAYRLLELIEHSWGYIIPHCGHWAMIEHPEDFTRATLGFLSN